MNTPDRFASLRDLRIGCVKYLNSQPLICAYDGTVIFEHPSVLAEELAAGHLDVALVPAFHALTNPDYYLVDGVAIACNGPVFSVVLAYTGELQDIPSIDFDPASLSSAHLVKIILAEFYDAFPRTAAREDSARLLIGNQAIEFRQAVQNHPGQKFLDLGEEWKSKTGLPFVFALWVIRPGLKNPGAVATALRHLKAAGIAQIPKLVEESSLWDAAFRTRYLSEHIRFDLGADELAGLHRYRELLLKYSHIQKADFPLQFV